MGTARRSAMTSDASPADQSAGRSSIRYTRKGAAGFLLYLFAIFYSLVPIALHTNLYNEIVLRPFPPEDSHFQTGATVAGIAAEEHWIPTADGSKLYSWFFRNPNAKKTVIYHHGNAGNIAHRISFAGPLVAGGASVLLYDYRGYGRSGGKPTVPGLVEDGKAAYNFVKHQLHVAPSNIVHYGESIGSGVAVKVASAQPCGGLILEAPIGALPLVGKLHFLFLKPYPDFLFPAPKFNNIANIKDVHVPLLITHGLKDTLVPYQHSQAILANANEPKKLVLLPNSDHNNINPDVGQFSKAVKRFITSLD